MRKLVLCEKPSVARDIARVLRVPARGSGAFVGDDFVITWCIGHLVELEEPAAYAPAWRRWSWDGLPMLPERFRLRPSKQTAQQWKVVRELLVRRDFAAVVNACDAGREGELIFRFCYELSGSKLPVERLWISSLTAQAISRGFSELRPGHAYDALAAAARCRAESDWLVGLNATRAMTLWCGGKTLLSIGRVQTPTLGLLVSREREIQRFVPRDYIEIEANLVATAAGTGSAPFCARFEYAGKRRFATAPPAMAVAERDRSAPLPWVESVEEKPVREPPPLLFDLGSLQRTCNRRFGWSAQHTLSLAQALYERHKLITYPRTDSRYLSKDLISQLEKTFAALAQNPDYAAFCAALNQGKIGAPRRIFSDHKVTDHHAIIPTLAPHTEERLAALSLPERWLLDLVARRFLGAFFPDAEFRETTAIVRVDAADHPPPISAAPPAANAEDDYLQAVPPPPDRYVARGRVRIRAGWQEVAGLSGAPPERENDEGDSGDEDKEKNQTLPPLEVGMRLRGEFALRAKKTRPPPRYTEASLLGAMEGAGKKLSDEALRQAMKDQGLGTPATRAAIIETLLDRGYILRRGKQLLPTELGLELISSLPVPDLRSPELTGQWEARLSRLSRKEESAAAFMADIAAYVRVLIGVIRAAPAPSALKAAPQSQPARRIRADTDAAATSGVRRRRSASKREPTSGKKSAGSAASRRRTAVSEAPRKKVAKKTALAGIRRQRTATALPVTSKALPCMPPPGIVPGTPLEPPVVCPRCLQARLLWGRRAWGCANFRICPLVIPYETDGRALTEHDLRKICAKKKNAPIPPFATAQAVTVSQGAASVASDKHPGKNP